MNDNNITQIDYEHVDLILQEADKYNLRFEVEDSAKKFIEQGYEYLEAFQLAYNEWIK